MSNRLFRELRRTGISEDAIEAFRKSRTHLARCAAMVKNQDPPTDGILEWLLYGVPYAATPKTPNSLLFNRFEMTVKEACLGEDFIQGFQRPAGRRVVSVAQISHWSSGRDFLKVAAEMYGDVYLSTDEARLALSAQCLSLKQADRFASYVIDSFKNTGSFRGPGVRSETFLELRLHQPVFVFVKIDFDLPSNKRRHSQVAVMEMRMVSMRELAISLRSSESPECWGSGAIFVGANIQEPAGA